MRIGKWLLCLLVVSVALLVSRAQGQETKKVQLSGRHVYTTGGLTDLAAVTIIGRTTPGSGKGKGKGHEEDFEIEIEGEDVTLDRISGYNHDINDKDTLIGSGDRPGITTDVAQEDEDLEIDDDVYVAGVPTAVEYDIDPIAVKTYVDYYKDYADITVDSPGLTTWTEANNVGGPNDYKVVYVEDAKLLLKQNFKGYGILVLYDTTPGAGHAELRMEDAASWYGLIIAYTEDSPGESDKIKIRLGNGGEEDDDNGKGKGKGKGKGPSPGSGVTVLGSILLEAREAEIKLDVADIYYCQQALANVDGLINSTMRFEWEEFKEVE
jgi:hypothetical protein